MLKRLTQITIKFNLDRDLICDDESLQNEFNGSLKELLEWFIKHDSIWQVINLAEDEPTLEDIKEIEITNGKIILHNRE